MSPSNSSKSLGGDPATYQHLQQTLFEVGNKSDTSSDNEINSVTEIGRRALADDAVSKVSSRASVNKSGVVQESSNTETCTDTESGVTSNPPLNTPGKQQGTSQQSSGKSSEIASSKPGLSDATAVRLPVVVNVGGTNQNAGISTAVSESNNSRINTVPVSTTTSTNTTNSSKMKVPERAAINNTSAKSKGTARRRGKWTVEEEEYVARVIQDFNSGFLNAPAGYTLRSYLSDKLQCDPMRITKKFTGESCIGKRVFHPAVRSAANATAIDKAQTELNALERRWRRRLELQQRESAKKAAASAAAANAASRGTVTVQGVPVSMLGTGSQNSTDSQLQQSAVTQAATWLDRANVILMGNIGNENQVNSSLSNENLQQRKIKDEATSTNSSAEDSLEHQMKEVQRLIYEGPIIQQTTAGLPTLLLRSSTISSDNQSKQDVESNIVIASSSITNTIGSQQIASSAQISPTPEPLDKRMKMTSGNDSNRTGAEDAEALVGFLRSVRASAAAGQDL